MLKSLLPWNRTASHSEKLLSGLGGFMAILLIMLTTLQVLELNHAWGIIASMGASAVLLFAVPHGPLSQPWPIIGGHGVSALIGISCALWIQDPLIAASLAVGLSISAMYYLNCLHPPGGATALSAVIGGEAVQQLGYQFVLTPVLLNALLILLVAMLFNNLFAWRRYPAFLQPSTKPAESEASSLQHEDFLAALKSIDSFVDVHEAELKRIFELANLHAQQHGSLSAEHIQLGHFYSNGCFGDAWSIRQIIDEQPDNRPEKDWVIFKQLAGQAPKRSDCVTRQEFARWAAYEVKPHPGGWARVNSQSTPGKPHCEDKAKSV